MLRKPAAPQRRAGVASGGPSVAAAKPVPVARALQQRLGNQGTQAFAAQLTARSCPSASVAPSLADAEELKAGLTDTALPHFAHDLSRIPMHPPTAGAIQTKLAINKPGDEYEHEADRVAEQVMRMPESQLQRACPCGGGCPKCQTNQPSQEHERLQTKRVGSNDLEETPVTHIVHEVLASSGQPLDPAARAFMESRFGHDFNRVRVHTDQLAARSAEAIAAQAYTVGSDVVFGIGRYAPASRDGQRLLAHELTHVVQQQSGAAAMIARQEASFGEKWAAFWGAGPIDAYRASELAKEALKAARQTGLPDLHNGPADAWRHCYWNCRMVQVIGEEDAADIAENHEKHGGNSTAERMMDTWNNEEGRECSGDCDTCCQSKLDAGELWVLYGGAVGASKPTSRTATPTGSKFKKY